MQKAIYIHFVLTGTQCSRAPAIGLQYSVDGMGSAFVARLLLSHHKAHQFAPSTIIMQYGRMLRSVTDPVARIA